MKVGARPFEGAPVQGRFARYCGLEPAEIYDVFDFANLIDHWPGPAAPGSKWDRFSAAEARPRVEQLWSEMKWERVVTLGRAATSVFWVSKPEWFVWFQVRGVQGAASPHPGGTSFYWNDPVARDRGIKFWRELRDWARDVV